MFEVGRWKEVYERQSSTLEQAVQEYERRYGLPPPFGFNVWSVPFPLPFPCFPFTVNPLLTDPPRLSYCRRFNWSRNNSVHFLDEYDALDASLSVFRGLSPANLREQLAKRVEELPEPGNRVFEIEIKDGVCGGRGKDAWPKPFGARSGEEVCWVSSDTSQSVAGRRESELTSLMDDRR